MIGFRDGPFFLAFAFFLAFFDLPESALTSSLDASASAASSLSASSAAPRRVRLPVGRTGRVTTAVWPWVVSVAPVSVPASVPVSSAEPAPSRSSLTACLSSWFVWSPSSVHTLSSIQFEQGRKDLNLQPAVLETAALPVELRPSVGDTLAFSSPYCAEAYT